MSLAAYEAQTDPCTKTTIGKHQGKAHVLYLQLLDKERSLLSVYPEELALEVSRRQLTQAHVHHLASAHRDENAAAADEGGKPVVNQRHISESGCNDIILYHGRMHKRTRGGEGARIWTFLPFRSLRWVPFGSIGLVCEATTAVLF